MDKKQAIEKFFGKVRTLKEGQMEYLIELLNEYENTDNWENLHQVEFRESKIISKKYGFIKWLVENDKIDTNNLSLKAFKNIFSGGGFVEVSDLEVLLMLLSISDTPIEDLISYLHE